MLQNLRIQNFALIEDIEVDFEKGLSILLGETGAGKSIIIEALSLLKGTKSSFSKIRDENKNAVIEGTFSFDKSFIKSHPLIKEYLEGENELIISRIMTPSKTSKARINGVTVSLSELRELMDNVMDIHSQGENYALFDESCHISFLDSFDSDGLIKEAKKNYQDKYAELDKIKSELKELYSSIKGEDRDFLEFQINEIAKFNLQEDEIEEMEEEIEQASGFEDMKEAYNELMEVMNSNVGFDMSLSIVKKAIRKLMGNNSALGETANAVLEKANDFEEALGDLISSYDNLDYDPNRIEMLNQRLYDLSSLRSKYGRKTSDILAAYTNYCSKLSSIDSFELDKERLGAKISSLETELDELGNLLHKARENAATGLETATNDELEDLGLLSGGFKVEITESELSLEGKDKVRFLLALNKGSRFIPLKEAASGGENSRLMLALKSLFNKLRPYDTIVFDEIDTGISGKIASMVGTKIKEVSKMSQTIVITHLPQVACKGKHHYLVSKGLNENEVTVSNIHKIFDDDVVYEIAKMLSGENVTESALMTTRELLKNA